MILLTSLWIPRGWQDYHEVFHFFLFYHSDVVLDELERLDCLDEVLLVEVLLTGTVFVHLAHFGHHVVES